MRNAFGWLVLIGGLAALGLWGYLDHASKIEESVTANANVELGDTIHPVTTRVSGRDIVVTGLSDSEEEHRSILARLNGTEGRRVVVDQLKVLEAASPYLFMAAKSGASIQVSGNKPVAGAFADTLGKQADVLELAAGMPDENWPTVAANALDTLKTLENGTFELMDKSLTFSGKAKDGETVDNASQMLKNLPEGYNADINIDWDKPMVEVVEKAPQDDTGSGGNEAPAAAKDILLNFAYSATSGAKISGIAPADLELSSVADILDLNGLNNTAEPSGRKDDGHSLSQLKIIRAWLPAMEELKAQISPSSTSIEGILKPGGNLEVARSVLEKQFGETGNVKLSVSDQIPADGEERVNLFTGTPERFHSGYWLPVVEFEVDKANCESKVDEVIGASKINFVSGSASLDPRSLNSVNAVSAILLKCLKKGDLTLEIGGHTDSQGADDTNMQLSIQRANAVSDAMIARGISKSGITAKGYGESQPVASNDTEEGRASNRRTTFTWSQN